MARFDHGKFEKNPLLFLIAMLVVVSIGGLVEIVPLFFVKSTIEKVQGMRPYTPLELAGRQLGPDVVVAGPERYWLLVIGVGS